MPAGPTALAMAACGCGAPPTDSETPTVYSTLSGSWYCACQRSGGGAALATGYYRAGFQPATRFAPDDSFDPEGVVYSRGQVRRRRTPPTDAGAPVFQSTLKGSHPFAADRRPLQGRDVRWRSDPVATPPAIVGQAFSLQHDSPPMIHSTPKGSSTVAVGKSAEGGRRPRMRGPRVSADPERVASIR